MSNQYIWAPSSDGTIMRVYEVYQPKFRRYHKFRQIQFFYADSFDDVKIVAEELVARLEAKS